MDPDLGLIGVEKAGLVLAALCVVGAFALRNPRARAAAMVAALLLAPSLLVVELLRSGSAQGLQVSPLLAAGALAAGLLATAALAALLAPRPGLLPVLAVATLPFRVPVAVGDVTASLLVPLYLVVAAGSVAYAWRSFHAPRSALKVREPGPGATELALLLALTLYAVQAVYSTDFGQALENVVFFYVPFALLLKLLVEAPWSSIVVKRCLAVGMGLALVFVAVGFWEYATRRLLLNPKVIASNDFESYFRVNSLFFDPNIYGRFLVMIMLALVVVLLWTRRTARVLLAAAALAVLWAGLVLTFSQSSFAALLAGLAVLAGLRWRARLAAVSALGVAIVAAAVVALSPGLARLEVGPAESLDRATSGRFDLVRGGLEMWLERPLVGYGSGSFGERYRDRENVTLEQATVASHTIPVTVAAEQGLVGLAGYVLLLLTAVGLMFGGLRPGRARARPDPAALARALVAAAFIALVVHTLLYAAFLEDPIAWTLLGAARGLASRSGAPSYAPPLQAAAAAPPPSRTRTGSSSP